MINKSVESIYGLSPMQQGMLFHSLSDPESGVYIQQLSCRLRGSLDHEAFARAWRQVIDRHSIMRTAFVWEGLEKPIQAVHHHVEFRIERLDWRGLSDAEQREALAQWLEADRRQGFQMTKAPLMRVRLIALSETEYVLIWTHHHMLMDGWSVTVLLREIFTLYESGWRRVEARLNEPRPYRDYIQWVKQQDVTAAARYWREKLKGVETAAKLPVIPSAGERMTNGAGRVELQRRLSPAVTQSLQQYARRQRLTLNTLVQGAWAYLLSRYGGEEDVIYGTTVNGRPTDLRGSENMVGLFINTLPLRIKVEPTRLLTEWLGEIQREQGEIEAYSYNSLIDIQGWGEIPRGTPLFETILVFENFPVSETTGAADLGVKIEAVQLAEQTNYPLTAVAIPGAEMVLLLSYDTQLFDPDASERLLAHWAEILESIVNGAGARLGEIKLLAESERRQLLEEWSGTIRAYAEDKSVHQLFERQVSNTPSQPAVISETEQLTYAELNARSNQLAHHLMALGVGPETCVGVCLERSPLMLVGLFGALKAGGAYVPLDPRYPAERLSFMLADSQVKVLITQRTLAENLPTASIPTVLLDDDWAAIAGRCASDPPCQTGPDNIAYVIYTSGSTGTPKGVAVRQAGLVNYVTMMIESLGLGPGHRFLQFASLSFDASAVQIYPTLLSGATLVTHRAPGEIPNLDLLRYCEMKGVTVIDLPAGHWSQWIDELATRRLLLQDQFQIFMTGGDRTSPERLRQWAELAQDNALFVSSYGPTEATIGATIFTTTRDEVLSNRVERITMGRPLGNTRIYVLDTRWWSETPIGVPGELFIGGAGVARNYYNAPELTAEKFIPDPFSSLAGDRLYRTGDLARFLPGGELEFLGRIDQQVKIRGLRVEPGEVEAALNAHPAVRQGVVLALADENGEKRLTAYLMINTEPALTVNSLRQFLKGYLPEHSIPTSFIVLDSMPLSLNGKVDRKRLSDVTQTSLGSMNDHAPPRTPLEESLAAIWRDVLKTQKLGVHDSFFALGGHSLIATQLVSRIRDVFRAEISLQDLFLHPTVAELGAKLQKALQDGGKCELPPLKREPRGDFTPLSYAQERLWFIERMEGGTPIFNLIGVIDLTGELHVAALEGSLNEVIRRHESLRSRFDEVDGVPAQIVMDERPIKLEMVDLADTPREERESVRRGFAQAEAAQPFDLTHEPLLRAKLLRFEADHHALILTIHHIISDGWSMGVLIRETVFSYRALVEGSAAAPVALPIQYADYALWQRRWLAGGVLEKELDYWREQLAGAPPVLELPADFPRPPQQTYQGAQQIVELGPELQRDLKKLSQQEGVTLFMVLLAAFKALIFRYTGQTDVVIGTPVAGRQHTETEALIGFFLNMLVLRTDLSGAPKFSALLRRVREVCLGAYTHQDAPFERLIEELRPKRDRRRSPLVQVVFNMLNLSEERIQLPRLMVEGVTTADQWSRFDLTLYAGERNGTLFLNAVYNRDLYAAETITRLLGHYVNLLRSVTKHTEQSIDALQFFSPEEVEEIKRGNRVRPQTPFQEFSREEVEQSVAERFEKQARLFQQKVALRSKRGHLTYHDLSLAAARVARDLERRGLGQRENVALFFNHDIEMIAAMIGALKAGKTYAPLDPIHPPQRLVNILADADCACVLTDKKNRDRVEAIAESFRQRHDRALQVLEVQSHESEDGEPLVEAARAYPDSLAYLLYTSGSTGRPKGVMQNHRNLLNHIRGYTNSLRIAPDDNLLLLASYAFDASVMDIYGALLNGATLSIYDLKNEGFDGMAGFIRDQKVTIFHSTPTVFRQFIARLADDELLPSIRLVVLGGEAAHQEDFAAFRRHFPDGCLMVNGLGPTESTLALQCFLDHRSDLGRRTIPVGYAVADTEALLLNESGEEAGLYAVGEIAIKSSHLALGYWKQPDLTAASFRPAADDPHKRIYLTGDLGRRLRDHRIDFCGRKDSQIKIRGQRIEVSEIEAHLSVLPEAQAAAVTAQLDAEGAPHLVGYVVGKPGVEIQATKLREALRRSLSEFMIPEVFVVMEDLPLTQTGKVNRNALPPVELGQRVYAHPLSAPRTPIEEMIAEIWRLVLPNRQIGVNEDFFAIGGHSLLAVQLISRIRESFGVEIELREIFERPTIALLAERVAEGQRMRSHSEIGPIRTAARQERAPLA
ncbi:MAG TPA: amino acid adenylation domain-containing protein, partial [Blastocatellia bacterium]|nr:amino acid adenylation domain-containing protein [Blastocatellia bacterium]